MCMLSVYSECCQSLCSDVPFSHVKRELTNFGLEFDKSAMSKAEYRDLCNLLYTNKVESWNDLY